MFQRQGRQVGGEVTGFGEVVTDFCDILYRYERENVSYLYFFGFHLVN